MARNSKLVKPPLKSTPEEADLKDRAVPGMAHFKGSGPTGKICRTCAHITKGARKDQSRCGKFKQMMGYYGPDLPTDTLSACKFYMQKT